MGPSPLGGSIVTTHTPVPDDGRAVAGATIAGRYELRAAIGDGGMGAVWRAHDTLLQRDVAVKEVLLPPELPPAERETLVERTLREARAAAALSHASVIRVFDVITEAGRPWIIMELLQARSLADIIKADGPMPPRVVAKIGLSMLGALEAAHAAGILHRDVKPGNVLISSDGRCVLSDFGVARTNQPSNLTTPGMVLGSAHYIAPERATGGQIGPASDLFSLGVTLYAAVEGRPPFDRANALATMQAVVNDPPESPRRAGPLIAILGGLLDKDPHRRWNVDQTRAALQQLLGGSGALASNAVDGLTDLHRVIPQQQQHHPVSSPPVSGVPVSGSGGYRSAGVNEATQDHPAPSPYGTGAHEQHTAPFTPPVPASGPPNGYGPPPGPPPFEQRGGYEPQPPNPYGPPGHQQPPPHQPYPPAPAAHPFGPPSPEKSGVGGLVDKARKHYKPWWLAVGAGVVVLAIVLVGIAVFSGDDKPGGTDPAGNSQSAPPKSDTEVYKDAQGRYSVNVPKGWKVAPGQKNVVNVTDPKNDDRWIRFNITDEGAAPDALLTSAVENLDGSYFTADTTKQISLNPIKVDGHDGSVIEYTGTRKEDGAARHGLWAIVKVDGQNYQIYLSVPEETFTDSKAVFDEAVKSFKLGK